MGGKIPSTEDLQAEGEKIAEQLGGLHYNGPWMEGEMFLGHTLTDTHPIFGTGTTFICKDLEDCRERLRFHREAFAAQRSPITRQMTAEVIKQLREEGLIPPPGLPPKEMLPETAIKLNSHTYPLSITQEDFETNWKPLGWKLIIIGPTATWRESWGAWESIRDIVQNCLDETESYESGFTAEGLWIADQGKGVAVADFLLGPPRLKPDFARGKFGEGMKIAALAMVRAGHAVHVNTSDKELWIVFYEQQVGNGEVANTLAALWRPATEHIRWGTRFQFIGYQGRDFKYRFATNVPRAATVVWAPARIESPIKRYNQVMEFAFPPEEGKPDYSAHPEAFLSGPRIFARDIYMRPITSLFSYNLWGFELAPDRHAPASEQQMWLDMGRTWACCKEPRLLDIFFQMVKRPGGLECDEKNSLSMDLWNMRGAPNEKDYVDIMWDNKDLWFDAFNRQNGENAVLRTSDRWDNTVKHLGYEPVSVSWGVESAMKKVLLTDRVLIDQSQERLREVQVIPDEKLSPRQLASLTLARRVADQVSSKAVGGVWAAIIPPASDRMRTAGMYGTVTQEIYINIDQLDGGRRTVDTTIHEVAHHISGAEDGEEAHNAALSHVAGMVVEETARGNFDEYLRDPNFVW